MHLTLAHLLPVGRTLTDLMYVGVWSLQGPLVFILALLQHESSDVGGVSVGGYGEGGGHTYRMK